MNSDFNKEMDLLLRRHGRRKGVALSATSEGAAAQSREQTSTGPHMDADEMNAYAEGQLPDAARERAVSHLADCDRCRAIVTGLTLAADVPVEAQERRPQQTRAERAAWRTWLAALFAPPVMRYATAALVIVGVVGATLLFVRQRRNASRQEEQTLVAQNNKSEGQGSSALRPEAADQRSSAPQASSPAAQQNSNAVPESVPAPLKDNKAGVAGAPADNETSATKTRQEEGEAQSKEAAKTDALTEPAPRPAKEPAPELSASRGQERDEDRVATNTADAPSTPRPPATTTTAPSSAGASRAEQPVVTSETAKNGRDKTTNQYGLSRSARTTNAGTAPPREAEESVAGNKPSSSTEVRRRSTRKVEAKGEAADSVGSSAGGGTAETRTVGGRQFRRQGSAWIDTAYSAGRATVNVTRGSEQYRALVADEPGLRTIAEQLGGEVVVVWKGRAYRIH